MGKIKRISAYTRVSKGTEDMLHSLAAQVSYYSKYIQANSEWEYAGIYADADETGTKDSRPEFQRLLADCRAGKIDMVITKTISRFARNTVTLLETVRELKALGIDVYFEEQDIHTLSNEGELMLTILASYAQEESRSASENVKWRKRNDMKNGKTKPRKVYGYNAVGGKLEINPGEAEVIREIFQLYLEGLGQGAIAKELNRRGIPSPSGITWKPTTVGVLIINPKMCGDLLHQRNYIADHLTKKLVANRGELPMYRIENAHEGIVAKDTFEAAQAVRARRAALGGLDMTAGKAFRKKIYCQNCGMRYWHRASGREGINRCRTWVCGGREKYTGFNCKSATIYEAGLMEATANVLGLETYDGDIFAEKVERIIAHDNNKLTFIFHDGAEVSTTWERKVV